MKHLLPFLLILYAGMALAQTPTRLPDQRLFKGNPYQVPVIDLALTDSATYTATMHYSKSGGLLPSSFQPIVTQSPGLLRIRIPSTTSLQALTWLEIKANGVTWAVANMITDKSVNTIPIGYPTIRPTMPDEPYVSLWQELIAFYNN